MKASKNLDSLLDDEDIERVRSNRAPECPPRGAVVFRDPDIHDRTVSMGAQL